MEPIDLILKIWGIRDEYRADVAEVFKSTRPEHLGLSLVMLAMPEDENDFNTEAATWMKTYLPELRFV